MSNDQAKKVIIDRKQFPTLFEALRSQGYRIVGPTVRENVVVYDEIDGVDDLPVGKTDEQAPGKYQLKQRNDKALFGFTVGPQSPKKFLFPMRSNLFSIRKETHGFHVSTDTNKDSAGVSMTALIGIKACELSAIAIQDKVYLDGEYSDSQYRAFREGAFIVALNCTSPGEHCFCVSMKTGPKVSKGFDLAMTEIINGAEHYFIVESGSAKGETVLKSVSTRPSEQSHQKMEQQAIESAVRSMGRAFDTRGIKELLLDNPDHPEWDAVAARCMTCSNCTLVCPTCFCSTIEDTTNLSGEQTDRWRRWNSCFTLDFTKVAGGNFRTSAKSRYRQWLTHKLAGWHEQFGTSGCVGCGRCITWCPVGIDILAEVETIRGEVTTRANKPT